MEKFSQPADENRHVLLPGQKTYTTEHKMLRHLISVTYLYIYFNQLENILKCYEETLETTVRRPAAATHTHTHTQLLTLTTVTTQGSYMK